MSEQENIFLKELKATVTRYIVGFIFSATTALIIFYFNTKYVTAQNTREIEALKATKANKELYEATVRDINRQLQEIKNDIKEIRK